MPRVLLIDAVEYADDEVPHKGGGPSAWFGAALAPVGGLDVRVTGCSDPALSVEAAAADAIILSGSPRDAWSDDPAVVAFVDWVRDWMNGGKPVLGVCYGHQVMARAMGGHVAPNPAGWELGNTSVDLTAAGQASPLFKTRASRLPVIESHQDAVLSMPPGATVLATNAHTAIQALAYGPGQVGVQFHPEFTPEILRLLWSERRDLWRDRVSFDLDARLDEVQATPEARCLFPGFFDSLSSS